MTVYPTQKVKPTKRQLDALQAEIKNHIGQKASIHASEWAEKTLGLKERKRDWSVKARMFETALIYERGLPLCANNGGYFLPKSEGEMLDYVQRLMLRAQSIVKRAQTVRRNFYHSTAKQATLPMEC